MVIWVKISTSVRLEDLCCHGYYNKHVVEVVQWSWIKETINFPLTGFVIKYINIINSSFPTSPGFAGCSYSKFLLCFVLSCCAAPALK